MAAAITTPPPARVSAGTDEPSALDRMSLNAEQTAAATHRGTPLLVVAGAGTGKTKTLVARLTSLLDEGVDPSRVLLLTFTRRAAAEMLGRVEAAAGHGARQVWGGTFHAVANRLLRSVATQIGLAPDFTLLDPADVGDLFSMIRSEHVTAGGRRFPKSDTIASIYSRTVNAQAPLDDVLRKDFGWCIEHREALGHMFDGYTRAKRQQNVLDYDDLLLFWRAVMASPLGAELRGRFDHVLVDEYQDTNPIQADIVNGLCQGDAAATLCVVGDDAQAIYGFRAATVAHLREFEASYPEAHVVTLEQNYRSTTPILDLANAVLAQSPNHRRKQLWTRRSGTRRPELVTCHDEADQARVVCDQILEARERGIDLQEQAVLFRAGHHADQLELELTRRDVPYVKFGGLSYLETAHVKDLLSLLRIADNPDDRLAWHRVLTMLDGVGPATAGRLLDELGVDDEASDALSRFIDGAGEMPESAELAAAELRAALGDCRDGELDCRHQVDRLRPYCVLTFPGRYDNAPARLGDLEQLAASAGDQTDRSRFLTELMLDPPSKTSDRAGPPHRDDDWLTLSTIHSAKGGEWRRVHLLHAADGNLPADMAISDADGLDEELRLAYVALTRAKDELTVTFPLRFHVHKQRRDDRHVYAQLSRFLEPVRGHFDESSTSAAGGATTIDLDPNLRVGVADEVDSLLGSLWSS